MESIHFRLPETLKTELVARSGRDGISAYLRAVLEREFGHAERHDDLAAALDYVSSQLSRFADHGVAGSDSRACLAMNAEILLLLRQIAGPQKQRSVHGILGQAGLDVWQPSITETNDVE